MNRATLLQALRGQLRQWRSLLDQAWQRCRPIERRLILVCSLASLLLVLLSASERVRRPTELIPAPGGKLVIALPEAVVVLNPLAVQTKTEQAISRLLYRGLFAVSDDRQLKPDLAADYQVSDGGRQIRVHLKPSLTFHDHQSVTSQDVVSTINWMTDDANRSPFGAFWKSVTVSAADPLTLDFTLRQPYAPFPWNLTFPVLPAHLAIPQMRDHLIGSGPYMVRSVKQDSRGLKELRLVTFAGFHFGRPLINEIDIKARTKSSGANALSVELPTETWLFFNTIKSPFDSLSVRQQLVAKQPLPPKTTLRIVVPDGTDNGLIQPYIDAWKKNGASVTVESKPNNIIEREIIPKREFDLILSTISLGGDPDSYPFWHSSQASPTGRNLSNIKDRALDRLLEEGRLVQPGTSRDQIYQSVSKRIDQLAVGIRLASGGTVTLPLDTKVNGILQRKGLELADGFNGIEQWYLKTKRVKK